jgi:catechol O-methyltransferase
MADMLDAIFGSDDEEEEEPVDGAATGFDTSKRPSASGVLQFHNGTEEAMYHFVRRKAVQGDSEAILRAVDEFCYTQHWMMHVGDQKLPLLQASLDMAKENSTSGKLTLVELGSYCGYSAIFLGSRLQHDRGDRLLCVEKEPACCAWTRRMLEYAGLTATVSVVQGVAADVGVWGAALVCEGVDLLFVDHDKSCYLSDLRLLEGAGLLHTGSIVVADNVLSFGVPLTEYLAHVRDPLGPYRSSQLHEGEIEYCYSGPGPGDAGITDGGGAGVIDGGGGGAGVGGGGGGAAALRAQVDYKDGMEISVFR